MLAVKRTCRDRWRQVLTEADRIDQKHLFTFQPGISEHQTAEMYGAGVRLVLPQSLFSSFTDRQIPYLINLGDFIEYVRSRQER